MDRREQEGPHIKVRATLARPSYEQCSELRGENSAWLFFTTPFSVASVFQNAILGRAPSARVHNIAQDRARAYELELLSSRKSATDIGDLLQGRVRTGVASRNIDPFAFSKPASGLGNG